MPVPSSAAGAPGDSESARPGGGWLDAEPALGAATRATLATLARRARGSWAVWVPAAIVLALLATVRKAGQPEVYSVTVVLRAVEGVATGTRVTNVALGELRADVDARAFTTPRLLEIMRRHTASIPVAVEDSSVAIAAFRDAMTVDLEENDFVEERDPGDRARSVLIAVSFRADDPEVAWSVVHELADALVASSQEGQRQVQERRRAAATLAVQQAAADLDAAERAAAGKPLVGVGLARARLVEAQAAEAAAGLAVNALGEHQVLRFDVVDAGLMPPRIDRREEMLSSFIVLLLVCLATGGLVAGAFDPRVLDALDLAALGAPVLGRVPSLPGFRDSRDSRDSVVSTGGHDLPRPPRV